MKRRIVLALVALFGAAMMVTAGGWLLGWREIWAFSYLIFLPTWLRWLLGGVMLAGAAGMLWGDEAHIRFASRRIAALAISCWVLIPLWGALLWLLRERTWYGDALLKLELLSAKTLRTDPFVWKEPLDSAIAHTLSDVMAHIDWSPEMTVALVSVVAGMVYLAAICYMANILFRGRWYRMAFVVGMLAEGSSQLWFGHIENYSVVTAMAMVSMALAVAYLHQRTPLWMVGLISGLAVSVHPQAVFLTPALLTLLQRDRWLRQIAILGVSGLVGPLFTVGLFLAIGISPPIVGGDYAGDKQLFWTPAQAFALDQLLNALSNLWLLTPLLPLWLAGGVAGMARRFWRKDRTFIYFSAVAGGLLIYHFWFQNDWPRYQDWDLYAIVGPGVTAWGLYSVLRLVQQERQSLEHARYWTPVLALSLLIAVLFSGAWIGVNHRFTLLHPRFDMREFYKRYLILDLTTLYPQISVFPPEPICAESEGCERVALTQFSMPKNGDTRSTIFAHAPASITFPPITVPETGGFLWLSPALDPVAWNWGGDGVTFTVAVEHEGQKRVLWSRHLSPQHPDDLGWQEVMLSLDDYAGESITLELITSPGPAGDNAADRAGWGLLWLMRGTLDTRFE